MVMVNLESLVEDTFRGQENRLLEVATSCEPISFAEVCKAKMAFDLGEEGNGSNSCLFLSSVNRLN